MAEPFDGAPRPVTPEGRQPCRCLLTEFWPDMHRSVAEYVELMAPEERAPQAEYARRLEICLACGELQDGTCRLCGCYVEARAAKRRLRCPAVPPRWDRLAEDQDPINR